MTTFRRLGAWAIVLAAAAAAAAACGGPAPSTKSAKIKVVPSVDQAANPPGWTPVVYGKAQVSVPPGSKTSFGGCPIAVVTVFLGHGPEALFCPLETGEPTTIYLEPTRPPLAWATGQTAVMVTGIDTYRLDGSPATAGYQVPSLGVQLVATGPLASRILSTLTYSPRAVALAPGPAPAALPAWHRISFGGISVAVPRTWRIEHRSGWGTCLQDGIDVFDHTVLLDAGTSLVPLQCAQVPPNSVPRSALDGVTIVPGRFGPLSEVGRYATCESVNGLRVCPSATEAQTRHWYLPSTCPAARPR